MGLLPVVLAADCESASIGAPETSGAGAGGAASAPLAYLSLDDGARLCARAFECPELPASITISSGIPIDAVNFSVCMTWASGPIPAGRVGFALQQGALVCVAGGTSCRAAGECLALERLGPNDPRCAGGAGGGTGGGAVSTDFCEPGGNSVLRCGETPFAIHCDDAYFAAGTRCQEGADQSVWCATGQNCAVSPSCAGSILNYCGGDTKLRFGIACSAVGNTCGVDPVTGSADCLTDGWVRLCDTVGTPACAGDSVEVCNSETISLFDCAEMGGTCIATEGLARCVRADDACGPYDSDVNACDGTSIALCVGGKKVSFDCASIGRACVTIDGSSRCG